MPITPTYPGVYLEEVPSGVRSIGGVGTSVAAFVGTAPRGPVDQAVRLLGFADYERTYGGLHADSEMSYAVSQFFQNGGTEAWAIRAVKSAAAASAALADSTGRDVLRATARDRGLAGNAIGLTVAAGDDGNSFDLTVMRAHPGDVLEERFERLSMNPAGLRFALDEVNTRSQLVRLERLVTDKPTLDALPAGTLTSAATGDVALAVTPTRKLLQVALNGLAAVEVALDPNADTGGNTESARLDTLCAAIQSKVRALAAGRAAYLAFTCAASNGRIVMTSGAGGEASNVRVLAADSADASQTLKLGVGAAQMRDGAAALNPAPRPSAGSLRSGVIAAGDVNNAPSAAKRVFTLMLDGGAAVTVDLGDTAVTGSNLAARLSELAQRIEAAVRNLGTSQAFVGFTCRASADRLMLISGSAGSASSVQVSAATNNDIGADLKLTTGAASAGRGELPLQGGTEVAYGSADVFTAMAGSRAKRVGIYALDDVDQFNLLVLPGVADAGTLSAAAAYCKERRAFLIVDAPVDVLTPEQMLALVQGSNLPRHSDHAAVYYPWVHIPDPLKNGKLRSVPPSGSIAGLFARTDAERGVWKAPAGTEAAVSGAVGLAHRLSDGENGILNPKGVNCLRGFAGYGIVNWGARTLKNEGDYRYVPVRRLALYIEESLYRGTQWVVFEPNDEPLWSQIRLNVGAFMNGLFRQGAFQGKSPREAYQVKCDSQTTTPDDINNGRVNIFVGFAPLKPAEFVVIRIQQMAGQIQT